MGKLRRCAGWIWVGLMFTAGQAVAQGAAAAPKVSVQANGDVDVPAEVVPPSKFLTPEAKAYLTKHLLDMQNPAMTYAAKGIPRFMELISPGTRCCIR